MHQWEFRLPAMLTWKICQELDFERVVIYRNAKVMIHVQAQKAKSILAWISDGLNIELVATSIHDVANDVRLQWKLLNFHFPQSPFPNRRFSFFSDRSFHVVSFSGQHNGSATGAFVSSRSEPGSQGSISPQLDYNFYFSFPVSLSTLDRDCFIIPVRSLERFLPAGVPVFFLVQ